MNSGKLPVKNSFSSENTVVPTISLSKKKKFHPDIKKDFDEGLTFQFLSWIGRFYIKVMKLIVIRRALFLDSFSGKFLKLKGSER